MKRLVYSIGEEIESVFDYPNGLLEGSEYKGIDKGETCWIFNSDIYRRLNLFGLALAVIVDSINDGFTEAEKVEHYTMLVKEVMNIIQYRKNVNEFNRKHNPQSYSPDIGNEDWYCKKVLAWAKNGLWGRPNWAELMVLVKCHIVWLKEDECGGWWRNTLGTLFEYSYSVDFANRPLDREAIFPKRTTRVRVRNWIGNGLIRIGKQLRI